MGEDGIFWISGENEMMSRAIRAAQATFPEFARQVDLERFRVIPAFESIAVKAFFPHPAEPTRGEHMFVAEISTDGQIISGVLNNDPHDIPGLRDGDRVSFPLSRLSDWILASGNRGFGGFTLDVMIRNFSPEQLRVYGSQPPICWFLHRRGTDAITQWENVPLCGLCGEKDWFSEQYRNGVCGLCQNDLKRKECTSCAAPILRSPGAPMQCHNCLVSAQKNPV